MREPTDSSDPARDESHAYGRARQAPPLAQAAPGPQHEALSLAERCARIRLRLLAQEHYGFPHGEAARLAFWRWLAARRGEGPWR